MKGKEGSKNEVKKRKRKITGEGRAKEEKEQSIEKQRNKRTGSLPVFKGRHTKEKE